MSPWSWSSRYNPSLLIITLIVELSIGILWGACGDNLHQKVYCQNHGRNHDWEPLTSMETASRNFNTTPIFHQLPSTQLFQCCCNLHSVFLPSFPPPHRGRYSPSRNKYKTTWPWFHHGEASSRRRHRTETRGLDCVHRCLRRQNQVHTEAPQANPATRLSERRSTSGTIITNQVGWGKVLRIWHLRGIDVQILQSTDGLVGELNCAEGVNNVAVRVYRPKTCQINGILISCLASILGELLCILRPRVGYYQGALVVRGKGPEWRQQIGIYLHFSSFMVPCSVTR